MGLSTGAHVVIGHGGILVPEEIMPHIRRDQEILLDDGKIKLIAERKYHHDPGDAALSVEEY